MIREPLLLIASRPFGGSGRLVSKPKRKGTPVIASAGSFSGEWFDVVILGFTPTAGETFMKKAADNRDYDNLS